jgi:hypothetical protein
MSWFDSHPEVAWPLLAALIFGPVIYRVLGPPPPGDLKSIQLFLKNRDEALVSIRKLWFGGPGRVGGRAIYQQTGRPYYVVGRGRAGDIVHRLAADGQPNALGYARLQQHVDGGWREVLQ